MAFDPRTSRSVRQMRSSYQRRQALLREHMGPERGDGKKSQRREETSRASAAHHRTLLQPALLTFPGQPPETPSPAVFHELESQLEREQEPRNWPQPPAQVWANLSQTGDSKARLPRVHRKATLGARGRTSARGYPAPKGRPENQLAQGASETWDGVGKAPPGDGRTTDGGSC